MASIPRLSLCTIAENVASAGWSATSVSSVISGTVSGPSTNGRVIWLDQGPTRHSKGPAAQRAVVLLRHTATSSTGRSNFARK
ncbi:hypothetical protein HZS56_06830 [Streptomyces sp. A108]|nr:hypothetical protein [Streptomyces sp. A108]